MSLRHPLARVKGLGASGDGSHHWWVQRLSALALIPLTLWFLFSIVNHVGDDLESVQAWIAVPHVAVLLIMYMGFMLFHGQLGMQVVIEDYIHHEGVKLTCLLVTKALLLIAAIASIFSILKIAL